jgi:hypothetical protein
MPLLSILSKCQTELFDDQPKYQVIAVNHQESTEATLVGYRQRGKISENGIKALKIGFGIDVCQTDKSRPMRFLYRCNRS